MHKQPPFLLVGRGYILTEIACGYSGPPPIQPPVTAFSAITMAQQSLALLEPAVLAALSPHPISSGTPRGMEELGVGYGYVSTQSWTAACD